MRVGFSFLILALFLGSSAQAWTVDKVHGDAKVCAKGVCAGAASGREFEVGAQLVTGADGKVFVRDGESELWVAPKSKFLFKKKADEDSDVTGIFQVVSGSVRAKFKRPSGPVSFPYEVEGKSVVASVRGTEFVVAVEGAAEHVGTLEGSVRVTSIKESAEFWDVAAGKALMVKPNEMPKVRDTAADVRERWISATRF